MIRTQNAAGGAVRDHRTIEAAARRIAGLDRRSPPVYLGYQLVECSGIHSGLDEEVTDLARELREMGTDVLRGYEHGQFDL